MKSWKVKPNESGGEPLDEEDKILERTLVWQDRAEIDKITTVNQAADKLLKSRSTIDEVYRNYLEVLKASGENYSKKLCGFLTELDERTGTQMSNEEKQFFEDADKIYFNKHRLMAPYFEVYNEEADKAAGFFMSLINDNANLGK